jgi:hypothetical protein
VLYGVAHVAALPAALILKAAPATRPPSYLMWT